MYKLQKYRIQRLSRKKYTGLSISRKSCRRRRHTKTKRCHIRSSTRRFRKYTIKRGNKRVRKNIQYNVAEAPAGGGDDDDKVENAHKFKEGDQVQFINNTNPNLILTVNSVSVSKNTCDVWNKYVGNITTSADKLELVTKPVLDAQKQQQEMDEQSLKERRALREAGEEARRAHLAKLDTTG